MVNEDTPERASLVGGLTELAELIGRRDWERARILGQRLVSDYPTSPTAHAALGDIAAARHLYREAAQWYELSLRLEPNAEVQRRLERARDALHAEGALAEEPLPGAEPAARPATPVLIAGALVVVALLATVIAVSVSARRQRPRTAPRATVTRPTTRPGALPAAPSPAMGPVGGATARPLPAGGPRVSPGAAPAPVFPGPAAGPRVTQLVSESVMGPMSDADYFLTRSLGNVTWPSGAPIGADVQVALDPFTGYAMVSVQIPQGMPKTPLFPLALDTAYKLAVTAIRSDRAVAGMTVRILATLLNEDGQKATLVAFRGNVNRERLDYYLTRNIQPDRQAMWEHVFAVTWWNPSVPAE